MKEKLCKLIDVKSLVTLALTSGFLFLAGAGKVSADQYVTIYTVIIGFYFGTQYGKREKVAE